MLEKTFAKSQAKIGLDEGLRQYMLGIYNYMAAGLAITGATAYLFANTGLGGLMFNPQGGMSIVGWLLLLSPLAMIFAFNSVARNGSAEKLKMMFWAFSALMGASLTPILLVYTGASMFRVFLITAGTFGAMSIYGYTTKKDLTSMGSFLRMGLIGVIIAMVVNMFMQSEALYYGLSVVSVFVFVGLTAYDTQKMREIYFSGDNSDIATKKILIGALSLYMDFINLFLALLRLMGDRK